MCLTARLVPGIAQIAGLVIGFGLVRAVVSGLAQISAKGLYHGGQFGAAPHVLGSNCCLIHAGDDSRATGCADTCCGEGISVSHALAGQFIDVRRDCIGVSEAADVRAYIFARKPQDVGLDISRRLSPGRAGQHVHRRAEADGLEKTAPTAHHLRYAHAILHDVLPSILA